MSSINVYNAEIKDVDNVIDLLWNYKNEEGTHLPDVDDKKVKNSIIMFLKKGQIILLKDLDIDELIGCAICYKSSYWFSSQECINLHTIYIKRNFRNFKLVNTLISAVKKIAKNLPIHLTVTTGNDTEPVFKRLGFENLGSNWRYN